MVHNAPVGTAAHLPLKRGLNLALIGPNADDAAVYQGQYFGPSCPEEPAVRLPSPRPPSFRPHTLLVDRSVLPPHPLLLAISPIPPRLPPTA